MLSLLIILITQTTKRRTFDKSIKPLDQSIIDLHVHLIFKTTVTCHPSVCKYHYVSLIWRRHHYRWKTAIFYLCSTFMAIEQWGFFSVPHLLWHGASVYYDHLRAPVPLTPFAFCVSVTTCFNAVGIRTPNLSLAGQTLLPAAAFCSIRLTLLLMCTL